MATEGEKKEPILDLSNAECATLHRQLKQKRKTFSAQQPLSDDHPENSMDFSPELDSRENSESKKPKINGFSPVAPDSLNCMMTTFDDNEFIFECLERITDELSGVKQSLAELPRQIVTHLAAYMQAEINNQFQVMYRKLSADMKNMANNFSERSHEAKIHLSDSHGVSVGTSKSQFQTSAAGSQTNTALSFPSPPAKLTVGNSKSLGVSAGLNPKSGGSSLLTALPNRITPGNNASLTSQIPSMAGLINQGAFSSVQNANQAVAQMNAAVAAAFPNKLFSLSQQQAGGSDVAASVQTQNLPPGLPMSVVTPKYIQAPVQIRIEDLKLECNVHRVKILDITPPVDVFELSDDFVYRIFLKYKYPSIFVQALFVLHFGSFKAMHLNTSSRVKNNLELIPESFVNRLTLLVVRWFPRVEDLDFGKCLNQKQRSILSAARSCLFFKKCDACKTRNIDSLPSTYSVKNLPLIAAHQQREMSKREPCSLLLTGKNLNANVQTQSSTSLSVSPTSQVVKSENLFPTPPLSDSLSPIMDLSESLTSVFDRVSELVNGNVNNNSSSKPATELANGFTTSSDAMNET